MIILLLLFIPTVLSQYSNTRVNLNGLELSTDQSFISYINGDGNGMTVQCECHISTSKGDAKGQLISAIAENSDKFLRIGDMSFDMPNPAEWLSITCSVRLQVRDAKDALLSVIDYTQIFHAENDDEFMPNAFPTTLTRNFADHPGWSLKASIVKQCTDGINRGFDCNQNCMTTTCNGGANICCPEDVNKDQCSCSSNPFFSSSSSVRPTNFPDDDIDCSNEDLYFWIMIGLACLSGLLLILLIVCLCYICCALSSEDDARKLAAQQAAAAAADAARPPPPVYLSTPSRDPRYGYRPPPALDPYGRPEAGYREEYGDDFDSLAAEWTESSTRREARV